MSARKHQSKKKSPVFIAIAAALMIFAFYAYVGVIRIFEYGFQSDKESWCGVVSVVLIIVLLVRTVVVTKKQSNIVYDRLRSCKSIAGIRFYFNENRAFYVEIPYGRSIVPSTLGRGVTLPKAEVIGLMQSAIKNGDVRIRGDYSSNYSLRGDGTVTTVDDVLYEIALWGAGEDFDYDKFPLKTEEILKSNYDIYPDSLNEAIFHKKITKAKWLD